MIGEKIVACNRRVGGLGKDVYDLFLWARRPFDSALVRRIAVLKAWTDRRRSPRFEPQSLLKAIEPQSSAGPTSGVSFHAGSKTMLK